ncbi:YheC/YheD family protein [Heyndrickxia sp. NPDC080065]|uniref:YheC/YheD family protein n=1 Tax=Heyndrickxia sp. NPDC080065 TaxID=3390568 RepID=UPI003CFE684C
MKASRGRIGQYKILMTEENLCIYMLETKLFSKESLYEFLEKNKAIIIKPVFGPGEIFVFSENGEFIIKSNTNLTTVTSIEDIYQHLIVNELIQKYYVIQPTKINVEFYQSNFHYTVTVHRISASNDWYCIFKKKKSLSTLGKYLYKYLLRKIESLSILAAKKLGEYFPECNTIVIEIVYDLKGGLWIEDSILHFPISKWSQYHTLTTNNSLVPYIPKTDLLTKVTFCEFLKKYRQVIIKPCTGQNGKGIVQISSNHFNTYEIHSGGRKFTKSTLEETYRFIEEHFLSKEYYIVQQKLSLAAINDCPMDIRVITQKVGSVWFVTGKIVKVAGNGFFITNAAQKLLLFGDAIKESNISHLNRGSLEDKIDGICLTAASQLEVNNPEIAIIGFDIGITHQGDIWIIEGNYTPDLAMFNKLKDKNIYRNIVRTKNEYQTTPNSFVIE